LADRIDRDGAGRIADIAARLDKLEAKANAAGAHDVSGAVTQLSARVDHLEKDQGARLDKLADRIDQNAAGHVAELGARLDKLETKVGAATAAAPKPAPVAKTEATKFEPSVSNETTGSIERPRPRLRGYRLAEVHNGYAMIDSPGGEFAVAPGDMIPGVGRVLRIERRGRDWVVVTTLGQIVAMDD
jgi:outer membrane murein-binding lipoprotein Lpp